MKKDVLILAFFLLGFGLFLCKECSKGRGGKAGGGELLMLESRRDTAQVRVLRAENADLWRVVRALEERASVKDSAINALALKLRAAQRRADSLGVALAKYSVTPTIVRIIDTVFIDSARVFAKKSPWYNISGRIGGDSLALDISVYDRLHIAEYNTAAGNAYVEFRNENPFVKYPPGGLSFNFQVQSAKVQRRPFALVAGPSVGIDIAGRPYAGVGISFGFKLK